MPWSVRITPGCESDMRVEVSFRDEAEFCAEAAFIRVLRLDSWEIAEAHKIARGLRRDLEQARNARRARDVFMGELDRQLKG